MHVHPIGNSIKYHFADSFWNTTLYKIYAWKTPWGERKFNLMLKF